MSELSLLSRTIKRASRRWGSPETPGWPIKRASPQGLNRRSWTIERSSLPTLFSSICQCAGLAVLGRSRPKCFSCARLESAGIKDTSVGLRLLSREVLSRAFEMVPSASASKGALAMHKDPRATRALEAGEGLPKN